jgi:hypothetical protein
LAEVSADGAQHLHVEVHISIDSTIGPHEARLEGVRIDKVEFTPHYLAPTGFLALLNGEATAFKAEHVLLLMENPKIEN